MISITTFLDICSREAVNLTLNATKRESTQNNEQSFLQYRDELMQRLFNYGMHAGLDRDLVKHCLTKLFSLVRDQPELLQIGISIDSSIFRMFRQPLIHQLVFRRTHVTSDILKIFFSGEKNNLMRKLTSPQRELVFLKFHCRLSYSEVAIVTESTVQQVRSEISKSFDSLDLST
jgi:DNA-directed RNA polymerase specialized sigma24 family protein